MTETELDALREARKWAWFKYIELRHHHPSVWTKPLEAATHADEAYIIALEADNERLREALKGVDELAAEGVGEFSLSSAQRDFLDIRDVVSEVLHKRPATPPANNPNSSIMGGAGGGGHRTVYLNADGSVATPPAIPRSLSTVRCSARIGITS